jgi:hypothetical protein
LLRKEGVRWGGSFIAVMGVVQCGLAKSQGPYMLKTPATGWGTL